ncbi:MAG TPA: hypothetical protein DCR93_30635 [Cytophagales bacterium]|nr:hypothetical protein [Cytophagales bacterium]
MSNQPIYKEGNLSKRRDGSRPNAYFLIANKLRIPLDLVTRKNIGIRLVNVKQLLKTVLAIYFTQLAFVYFGYFTLIQGREFSFFYINSYTNPGWHSQQDDYYLFNLASDTLMPVHYFVLFVLVVGVLQMIFRRQSDQANTYFDGDYLINWPKHLGFQPNKVFTYVYEVVFEPGLFFIAGYIFSMYPQYTTLGVLLIVISIQSAFIGLVRINRFKQYSYDQRDQIDRQKKALTEQSGFSSISRIQSQNPEPKKSKASSVKRLSQGGKTQEPRSNLLILPKDGWVNKD